MAVIRPFRALRPTPELADRVAAPPYDVVDTAEAAALATGNPDSFLHVSRPEIDLPEGSAAPAEDVHRQGRSALEDLVRRGVLLRDEGPGVFVYRQRMGDAVQTGVVCCTSVEEYDRGAIATHEHTRPDKEADRTRHIDVLDAHDEPLFLMYRDDAAGAADVAAAVTEVTAAVPLYDLTCDDGVSHTVWRVADPDLVQRIVTAFDKVPVLYVADGHHRTAAASRLHADRVARGEGTEETGSFLSVLFPASELTILAYNRVVRDLGAHAPAAFLRQAERAFTVTELDGAPGAPGRHEVGVYLAGRWYLLTIRPELVDETDPIGRLDVALLQEHLLAPLLGVLDPRTDQRIAFVGGIRGTAELERLVDSGRQAVAFALHPTSPTEVMDVADLGEVMPPKSTWFEPKLRSGLFAHPLH